MWLRYWILSLSIIFCFGDADGGKDQPRPHIYIAYIAYIYRAYIAAYSLVSSYFFCFGDSDGGKDQPWPLIISLVFFLLRILKKQIDLKEKKGYDAINQAYAQPS